MNMDQLERECRCYTKYLIGESPSAYVIEKYKQFHQNSGGIASSELDSFNRHLLEISARGPKWARIADSYATRFRKGSALRKKLVVVLGILECTPPSYEKLDAVPSGGLPAIVVRLTFEGFRYGLCLLLGTVLFTPVRLFGALSGKARPSVVMER